VLPTGASIPAPQVARRPRGSYPGGSQSRQDAASDSLCRSAISVGLGRGGQLRLLVHLGEPLFCTSSTVGRSKFNSGRLKPAQADFDTVVEMLDEEPETLTKLLLLSDRRAFRVIEGGRPDGT
jgi:hypothetical protein